MTSAMAKVAATFSFNTDWKEKVLHVAPGFSQRPKNGANNEKKNRRDVKLRKKHHSDSLNFARWRRGSSDTGMPAVQRICSRMASRKGLGRMSRPDVEQAARSDSLQCLGKAAHKMLESWCPHIQNRQSEYQAYSTDTIESS